MKCIRTISFRFNVLTLGVVATLASCNREDSPDCFQSAGQTSAEYRDLADFSSVELNDYIQFELLDTNYYGVVITAPNNLINDIETEVIDGKLSVRNANRCNFVRSFKNRITVRICAPDFRDIQNYGTGNIISVNVLTGVLFSLDNRGAAGMQRLTINADTVNVSSHTGVSDAIIDGECEAAYLFCQGVGYIDARNLVANSAFVNNSSLNDVFVHAHDYLYGYIRFSGNIFYVGEPQAIDSLVEGAGAVQAL